MDARTALPGWQRAGVIAFGMAWAVMATAETLLGDLDALDDVAVIAAHSGQIAAAGLLHVLAGALLVWGLAAVAGLAWHTVPGRIGWVVTAVTAPGLGAFGMLHLLAVETAAPGLDAAAMQQFLVERLSEAPGAWAVPMLVVAFFGAFALTALVAGLARSGVASWGATALLAAGAVVHLVGGGVDLLEVAGNWGTAVGLAWAAVDVWRTAGTDRRRISVPAVALADR
jgi:hypothetical protein